MIHIFTGDRILYEGPSGSPLTLVDVESSGNCGWGSRILNNPLVVHGILRTSNNGTGEGCEAGGFLVQGAITDASDGFVETRGNNGPGLVDHDDISISLLGFASSDNKGPGIQTLFGSITVNRPNGGSSSLAVGGNEGPGIFTSTDTLFDPGDIENDSEEIPLQSIMVKASIEVSGNGGWGIFAEENGTFSLTWTPTFGRAAYSRWKASSAKMGIRTMAACFFMTPGSWWHRRASATPGVWAPVKVTFSSPLWKFLPTTDPLWPPEETLTSEKVISAETQPT